MFQFGQEYIRRRPSGAWAFRSTFRWGTGLFNATDNSGSTPDSQFFSWLGQAQRVQIIGNNNLLIIQLDLQLTPDALLPSQQFVIGGGQSVRGYRQNLLAGDNGFRFSIENRMILSRDEAGRSRLFLAPFIDVGGVLNVLDNPNFLTQEAEVIAGLGLGVWWQPFSGLELRLDYGFPLVDRRDRGDNLQDDGFYFNASYSF